MTEKRRDAHGEELLTTTTITTMLFNNNFFLLPFLITTGVMTGAATETALVKRIVVIG